MRYVHMKTPIIRVKPIVYGSIAPLMYKPKIDTPPAIKICAAILYNFKTDWFASEVML